MKKNLQEIKLKGKKKRTLENNKHKKKSLINFQN